MVKRKRKKLISAVLIVAVLASFLIPASADYQYSSYSQVMFRVRGQHPINGNTASKSIGYFSSSSSVRAGFIEMEDEDVMLQDLSIYIRYPEVIAAGSIVSLTFSFWLGLQEDGGNPIMLTGSSFTPKRGDAYYSSSGVSWGADFQNVAYSKTFNWVDIVPNPQANMVSKYAGYYTYTMEWVTSIATNMTGIYLYPAASLTGYQLGDVQIYFDSASIRYSSDTIGGGGGSGSGGEGSGDSGSDTPDVGDSPMQPGDTASGVTIAYQYRNSVDSPVTSPTYGLDDANNNKFFSIDPASDAKMFRLTDYIRFIYSLPSNVPLTVKCGFWAQMIDESGNPISYSNTTWKYEWGSFTAPSDGGSWITDVANQTVDGTYFYKTAATKPCPGPAWKSSSSYGYFEVEFDVTLPKNSNGFFFYIFPNSTSASAAIVSNFSTVVDYFIVSYGSSGGSSDKVQIDWPQATVPEVDTGLGSANTNLHDKEVELWEQFEDAYENVDLDFTATLVPFFTSINWFNRKVELLYSSNDLAGAIVTISLVFGAFCVLLGMFARVQHKGGDDD